MTEYTSPSMEIIQLHEEDIIRTSNQHRYDQDGDGFVDGWY